ncbi:unnamed protein product [Chrysoparadoxa australica]
MPASASLSSSYPRSWSLTKKTISKHTGTVLEHESVINQETPLSTRREERVLKAFNSATNGSPKELSQSEAKGAVSGMGLEISNQVWDKLVNWEFYCSESGKVNEEGFLGLCSLLMVPDQAGALLRKAAGRGDDEMVSELLMRGCCPNAQDGNGSSVLHHAASHNQLETAKKICKQAGSKAVNMNSRDNCGWTPLMACCANGHVDFVRWMLKNGADIHSTSTEGRSALHCAATKGREEVIKVLLGHKATINLQDKMGWTALHCAVNHGHVGSVRLLRSAGSDAPQLDILGYGPDCYAPEVWEAATAPAARIKCG